MNEERPVNIEDLGAVNSLSGFNPFPLDSRELMIDTTESLTSDRLSYHFELYLYASGSVPLGLQHGQSVSFIMYAKIDSHMRNAVFELLRETRNDLVS